MNRVEQFKLFDSSKSIVIAVNNKLPSLDASNLYNLPTTLLEGGTSNSAYITIANGIITPNVKVSSAAGNKVVIRSDGLYVAKENLEPYALKTDLENKVDKVFGMGLSTNDFSNDYKEKVDSLTNYTLPIATSSSLGGVMIVEGSGLTIDSEGHLFVESGGGSGGGAVLSVNGKVGVVVLSKDDIGLGNVENTADADKPISIATQEALNNKLSSITFDKTNYTLSASDNTSFVIAEGLIKTIDSDQNGKRLYYDTITSSGSTSRNYVNLPVVNGGSFSGTTLTLNTNYGNIEIEIPQLSNTYTGETTNSIVVSINSETNVISANVRISSDENNRLVLNSNGLYVAPTDLSGYVTTIEYNSTKHTHTNKSVLDLISKDTDDSFVFNGNKLGGATIFTTIFTRANGTGISWTDDVVTFTHNLGTLNIINVSLHNTLDETTRVFNNFVPVLIDTNNLKIKIPTSFSLANGTWNVLITALK